MPAESENVPAGRGQEPSDRDRAQPTSERAADASPATQTPILSAADRALLDLETRTYRSVGGKERAIREELGLTSIAYHARLAALLDDPAALRYAPATIRRAQARRDAPGPA